MSSLSYNGILISDIKTLAFDQTVEYDPSGVDYMWTKFRIRVQGIINATLPPAKPVSTAMTPGETPDATIVRIRKCLLAPRQQLYFGSTGVNSQNIPNNIIIQSPPTLGTPIDSNNGPKPISLSIAQITKVTFIVTYEIETCLTECCSGSSLPYVSNRWRETHDIDQQGYVKRTIQGQVMFRSDEVNTNTQPGQLAAPLADYYRSLVSPPNLPFLTGFIRESAHFNSSADGLQLTYNIVDKQQYCFINNQITKFEGTRSYRVEPVGGVVQCNYSIRAWAPPSLDKATLYGQALAALAAIHDAELFIKGGSASDHIEENFVEVTLHGIINKPNDPSYKGMPIPFLGNQALIKGIGGQLNTDKPPQIALRGAYGPKGLTMGILQSYLGMCQDAIGTWQLSQTP